MLNGSSERPRSVYLVGAGSKQEEVEWNGGNDIDEEPAFEVVDGDLGRMADHLILLIDVRRPEIDENIDDEHDVDNQIDDCDRIMIPTARQTIKHSTGSKIKLLSLLINKIK